MRPATACWASTSSVPMPAPSSMSASWPWSSAPPRKTWLAPSMPIRPSTRRSKRPPSPLPAEPSISEQAGDCLPVPHCFAGEVGEGKAPSRVRACSPHLDGTRAAALTSRRSIAYIRSTRPVGASRPSASVAHGRVLAFGDGSGMFESLTAKLGDVFDRLRRRGALSEADVDAALREVRVALLEADVALPVVKDFIAAVRERAIGQEVLKSVTPAQMVVKIVHDHLVEMLGGAGSPGLTLAAEPPVPVLMIGLQG